jgi:ATP-binding cassette, subfamily B, bacterial
MTKTTDTGRKTILLELATILLRVRQVWALISARQRRELLGAVILMAAGAYFNAHIPVVLGNLGTSMELTRTAGESWGLRNTWPFLAWLAGYFLLREALQVIFKYLVHDATTRVEKEVSVRLVSHLLRVDIATIMQERVGSLHGRIRRSVEGLVRLLKLGFMDFWPSVLTAAFAMGMAIHRQPVLGLLMVGVAPIATFIVVKQIGSQKGIRLALLRSKENLDGTVVEQLGGIEYVRAAHTYEREVDRVAQVAEIVRAKEIKHHVAMSMYDGVKALNEGSFFIIVVAVAISFAARGFINIGEVLAYALFFNNVLTPLREVHRIIDEAHESALKVGDLMDMMTESVDRSFGSKGVDQPALCDNGDPLIVMKDLIVKYSNSDGKGKKVLDSISVNIRQGETIGVAGRSGCGKSTWLRTLLRLVHPSDGTLLINGVPIESVSRAEIGKLFGYVGQEAFLFSGSIKENIAYGCDGATLEEVRRAAAMACIDDEIMAFPGNYDAQIAERGKNLSGGQRQRIALARVFLKSPPILIMDEATSALDNISERDVLRALTKAKTGRTVIMVAHRLSTLRDSDRILVFDQGRIVESGHYDELLQAEGAFAELVRTAAEKDITRAVAV